ncbi:MAG: VanZ family protein [Chloroflexi bacterium]|nr:VanZ family protein [Chloroflexota bacterium]MCC6897197.1 VanZ family protein [Anaerolineae bacterium]
MILKLKSFTAPYIDSPTPTVKWFRIALALGYTALLTLVLVQSSANPLLGPAAPREFDLAWEILLTMGHLVGFSILVLVNWSALATVTTSRRALVATVVFACLLGLISELLQTLVPDRSASLFDLGCDWLVAFATAYVIHRLYP